MCPQPPAVLERPAPLHLGVLPANRWQRDRFGERLEHRDRIILALRAVAYKRSLESRMIEKSDDDRMRLRDHSHRMYHVAGKLERCLEAALLMESECGTHTAVREMRCKSKVCPLCYQIRAREIRDRMTEAIKPLRNRKLLTLTLKSVNAPLRDQLINLRRCWRKLRNRKLWRECVDVEGGGGVGVVEITRNKKTGLWHPHIHAVIGGNYMPQDRLSALWKKITGNSKIVDIRAADAAESAEYLTKHMNVERYLAKGADLSDFTDEALAEWATNIHAMRFVETFGPLRAVNLEDMADALDAEDFNVGDSLEKGATDHALSDAAGAVAKPKVSRQLVLLNCLAEDAEDGVPEAQRLYIEFLDAFRRLRYQRGYVFDPGLKARIIDYAQRQRAAVGGWTTPVDDAQPPPAARAPEPEQLYLPVF